MQIFINSKNQDNRGQLYTSWDARHLVTNDRFDFHPEGIGINWVQDRVSQSKHAVVRGFHSSNCWKLVTVVWGRVRLVIYDPITREKDDRILCSEDNTSTSVLIPPNTLIAHQCLSLDCVLLYKWSDFYTGPDNQVSVTPFDTTIGVEWEFTPILSERDQKAKSLEEVRCS